MSVPREPPDTCPRHQRSDESGLDEQSVLECAKKVTDHVSRIVYPGFSLNRDEGCEIHVNAFWDLQTYLGLRERLAVNEGARSFVYDSQRDRTPLGHVHRNHLRDLSVERIREMYHQSIDRLLKRVAETKQFHRAGIVAIDSTYEPFPE